MAEFKLVISDPKKGKSVQKEIKDDSAKRLIGQKIGDTFKGEIIDMPGYEFQITGGSDSSGFPMRNDVQGTAKKKITAVKGVGVKNKKHLPNPKKKGMRTMAGMRQKKTVAGNTIHAKTAQINVKIIKQGREPLFEEVKPEPAADAPQEKAEGGDKVEEKKEVKEPEKPTEVIEEEEEETSTDKDESEEVTEEAEEVAEETEEVPLGGGENVDAASEAHTEGAKKKAPAEEKEEAPAEDNTSEELDKIEEEVKKDEEEIEKESEEIEKIEKELAEDEKKDE